MFQYGALRGDRMYVQEVAKFLSERYQEPVNRFVQYLYTYECHHHHCHQYYHRHHQPPPTI